MLLILLAIIFIIQPTQSAGLNEKLSGRILLQVEKNGEAWYVYPNDLTRHYLGSPNDAFDVMKKLGIGISENDFNNLNGYGNKLLTGKIILRVQAHGEAYYVNVKNLKLHYLGRPADAFQIMRELGLGITNNNLSSIKISLQSKNPVSIQTTENQDAYTLNYQPKISNANTKGINIALCLMRWTPTIQLPAINHWKNFFSSANDYYNEISLGNTYIKSIQIAYSEQIKEDLPKLFNEEDKMAVKYCDSLIDFSNIDVLIVYPSTITGRGGASMEYMLPLQTFEKKLDSRVLIGHYDAQNGFYNHLSNDQYGLSVIIHEIAHTKLLSSIQHDNSFECGTTSFQKNKCSVVEYGNPFSTMSTDSGHFSAWFKYLAGSWIKKTDVKQDGQYSLAVLENPSSLPQLIRIPFANYPICLEYRRPLGIDDQFLPEKIKKLAFNGGIPNDGCLFISICTDDNFSNIEANLIKGKHNYLLDSTPASQPDSTSPNFTPDEKANYFDIRDACLTTGKTFMNNDLGINISFSKTNQSNIVEVSIDLNEGLDFMD